jgi:hypothetical protein
MSEGFMTRESAERAIWSYYWQLDNHRDRRGAPLLMEPDDVIGPEEAKRLRDAQTPFHQKLQLRAWDLMQRKSAGSSLASGIKNTIKGGAKWLAHKLTSQSQREYYDSLMKEAHEELYEEDRRRKSGAVDPNTGLPYNEYDLQVGRAVVSGRDLCLDAMVPPEDLAMAATVWLPPEDGYDEANNGPEWGSKLEHWQALGNKDKDKPCRACRGQGVVQKKVKKATSTLRNIIIRDEAQIRNVRCDDCGGRGSTPYWEADEIAAIKHNTRLIGEVVAELAVDGLFDETPIDKRDVEMGDLVWKDKAGLSIGFRLTQDGYDRMQEYCAQDDELQQVLHVLALAGKHVRDAAPDWAQREYKESKPIQVKPIQVKSGGFAASTKGGGFKASTVKGLIK